MFVLLKQWNVLRKLNTIASLSQPGNLSFNQIKKCFSKLAFAAVIKFLFKIISFDTRPCRNDAVAGRYEDCDQSPTRILLVAFDLQIIFTQFFILFTLILKPLPNWLFESPCCNNKLCWRLAVILLLCEPLLGPWLLDPLIIPGMSISESLPDESMCLSPPLKEMKLNLLVNFI